MPLSTQRRGRRPGDDSFGTVGAGEHFALPVNAASQLRILLIEDSPADAELLSLMLEARLSGVVVDTASTLAAAAPYLAGPLDIVITDLTLPDADDLQALTTILSVRPDSAVVVMTGRDDPALALRALAEGAEDFLVKGTNTSERIATAVVYAAQRRSAEMKARRYERLALSLLQATEAPTCAVDGAGLIIAANQAWRDFSSTAASDGAHIGASYFDLCGDDLRQDAAAAADVTAGLRDVLSGRLSRFERDYSCVGGIGHWVSVRANTLPDSGAVLSHVDISAVKQAEYALTHLALHDPLTNLPNRQLLSDRVSHALAAATRSHLPVGVLFIDLDGFKQVNDSGGHAAGDELLVQVAERLLHAVRPGDTVARIGGDEFAIVCVDVADLPSLQIAATRVLHTLGAPFALTSGTHHISGSIGLQLSTASSSPAQLLADADAAMYAAKKSGKNRVALPDAQERIRTSHTARLTPELHAALENDEFVMFGQPVVDLRTGNTSAVETLLRWRHPRRGVLRPCDFFEVIEQSPLMREVGVRILNESCRLAASWFAGIGEAAPDLHINVSGRQLDSGNLVLDVLAALERSELPPSKLVLELAETELPTGKDSIRADLTTLRERGIRVAIDDLGTGYSSLTRLTELPVDILKIDVRFVAGLGFDPGCEAVVRAILGIGHAMGLTVIAEGVETRQQAELLGALGCRSGQGHLYSEPLPEAEIMAAISAPIAGPMASLFRPNSLSRRWDVARLREVRAV